MPRFVAALLQLIDALFQLLAALFQLLAALFQLLAALFQLVDALFQLLVALFQLLAALFQLCLDLFQLWFTSFHCSRVRKSVYTNRAVYRCEHWRLKGSKSINISICHVPHVPLLILLFFLHRNSSRADLFICPETKSSIMSYSK